MFKYKVKMFIFTYIIVVVTSITIISSGQESINIDFLDIGQGDSCIIEYNNSFFIVDAGSNYSSKINTSEKVTIPYLQKKGIKRIDGIFISHFDYDHCGGIIKIIENLNVGKVYLSYIDLENKVCFDIIEKCSNMNIEVVMLEKGDTIKVNKNFSIKVLNPNLTDNRIMNDNNLSLVLLLNIYNNNILLTGDIDSSVENKIIEQSNLDVDILKVPHHGSMTSSSLNFIKKIKPETAVISVGKNNYNHPNIEVVDRYKNQGVDLFRTDKDGQVIIKINRNSYKIDKILKNEITIRDLLMSNRYNILGYFLYFIISILLILKYKDLEVIYEL